MDALKNKEHISPEQASQAMIAVIDKLPTEAERQAFAPLRKALEDNPRNSEKIFKQYKANIESNEQTQGIAEAVSSNARSAVDPFADVNDVTSVISPDNTKVTLSESQKKKVKSVLLNVSVTDDRDANTKLWNRIMPSRIPVPSDVEVKLRKLQSEAQKN